MKDLPINRFVEDIGQLKWLLLAASACVVMVYGLSMKKRAMRVFASPHLHSFLVPNVSWPRRYLKAILLTLALVSIVLALLGPRWGLYFEEVQQRQLDMMICMDVSRSMLAEDAGMSRLDRAKDDIKRLLDRLTGGSVGLVTFAGKAELACPLTDDYEYFRLVLDDVGIYSAPVGGTNIGNAIAAAHKALGDEKTRDRTILLITDGEDHSSTAIDEAKLAHDDEITVYTIGIGDDKQGALVPIKRNGHPSFLKYQDQQLWSKMDPTRLQAIARAGGGEYQPSGQVTATERTLEWIYQQKIAPLQKQAQKKGKHIQKRHVRFHWFAGLALALLMIETLISEQRQVRT